MEKLKYIKNVSKIVAHILKQLKEKIKVGICGKDLEIISKKMMLESNVYSSSLNYKDFPAAICVSVSNEKESELTHGIPNDIPFKKGDLVSVDVACYQKDEKGIAYHADAALTTVVGEIDNEEKNNLIKVTRNCLYYVITQIMPGITTVQDIGKMIQEYVESRGYYTIKDYGGHGIGNNLHEEPFIPNYKILEKGQTIKSGMFLCIEPLVQKADDKIAKKKIRIEKDKEWEVIISKNGYINAHFEHTIYINEKEAIILTNYD